MKADSKVPISVKPFWRLGKGVCSCHVLGTQRERAMGRVCFCECFWEGHGSWIRHRRRALVFGDEGWRITRDEAAIVRCRRRFVCPECMASGASAQIWRAHGDSDESGTRAKIASAVDKTQRTAACHRNVFAPSRSGQAAAG